MWPRRCRRFAQSSGTSDGKSKYIPVTDDSLRHNHYYGGAAVVAHYLDLYRDSRLFAGKSFILGGSFANELKGLDAAYMWATSQPTLSTISTRWPIWCVCPPSI